jgi:hypothetical protein
MRRPGLKLFLAITQLADMVERQFGIQILPVWHEKPAGNAAKYTRDVRAELTRILHSRAGRALADSLRFQFSPAAPRKRHDKRGNAVLVMPYEGNDDNSEEDGVTPGAQQSVVLFTPATRANCCSRKPAALPHEILVHELVHSLRRVSGHLHRHRVSNRLQPYTNTEEFLAILVTNIFISDVTNHHKTSLRANHQGHAALDPELAGSFRFFSLGTAAFNAIANFCSENGGFTRMLADVPAPFNPVAAYYKNRAKAFDMAANGDADDVFESMTPIDYFKAPDGAWKRILSFPGPPARGK